MEDQKAIMPIKPIVGPAKPILGPPEQLKDAPPFLVPNFPGMEKVGGVKTVVTLAGQRPMAVEPVPPAPGQAVMEKWAAPDPTGKTPPATPAKPDSPQQAISQPPAAAASDGYVRVEMHSENGKLSIVGVHEVAGPLVIPGTVARGYVYEAIVGDQQVALGSLTDVGISRSFANRDVPGPEGKHRIFPRPSFNFFVRIPKAQLNIANLPRLNIVLHTVTEAPDRLVPLVPLAKQTGVQTVEVARLPGVQLETLSPELRPQLERLLPKQ